MRKKTIVKCEKCGREICLNVMKLHLKGCDGNPIPKKERYIAKYPLNGKKVWNEGLKIKDCPSLGKNKEAREKIGKNTSKSNKNRFSNIENRKKHSDIMIEVAKKYPDSYGVSNRSRAKHYEYKGQKFQGTWELEFFKFCERKNIRCRRNRESFPYFWKEKTHYYYPDFYLIDFNVFVEIKGYETDRDIAKQRDFPVNKKLLILRKKEYDLFIKDELKVRFL